MNIDEVKYFENLWNEIYTEGIELILTKADNEDYSNIKLEVFTKLYSKVSDILLMKSITTPSKLNDKLENVVKKYTLNRATVLFEDLESTNTKSLLFEFSKFWSIYNNIIIKWTLKVFSILNTANSKLKKNISLKATLLKIIKEVIFDKLKANLLKEFFDSLSNLKENPNKESIMYLAFFINFLQNISYIPNENYYNTDVENNLVHHILEINKDEINSLVNSSTDLVDFLDKGLILKSTNIDLYSSFLPANTVDRLKQELDSIIFYNNSKRLLDHKLMEVFMSKDEKAFSLVYKVFKGDSLNSIPIILSVFKLYIKNELNGLIAKYDIESTASNNKEVALYTDYLINFQNFYLENLNLLTNSFENNNSIKIAFMEVIEHTQLNNPKYNNSYVVPYYLDNYLCGSSKIQDNIGNNTLSIITNLFYTIPDKDIFIDQHKRLLSNRFFNHDVCDLELEKELLFKLKSLGGENYTSDCLCMINDYIESKLFTSNLSKYTASLNKDTSYIENIKVDVLLINMDKWPKLFLNDLTLPSCLTIISDSIKNYYRLQFPNRSIKISHEKSIVELTMKINNKVYTLLVNNYQASILNLFNNKSTIPDDEVIKILQMSEMDYNTNIKLLSTLLIRNNNSISINYNSICLLDENSIVRLNLINNLHIAVVEKIEDDRSYAIEAAIVRIMKRKLKLSHNDLVSEINNEIIMFKVNIDLLKKKVDNLIEREIIVRDDSDVQYYKYNY